MRPDIDPKHMQEIKDHAIAIAGRYNARDEMFRKYDQAYLLDWEKAKTKQYTQEGNQTVTSPDARNYVVGAVRLLIATDPIFRLTAHGKNKDTIEAVERGINLAWTMSGMQSGSPIHHDQVTSAVLYAEIHSAVTLTKDLLKYAEEAEAAVSKEQDSINKIYAKAAIKRAEKTYSKTPFIVENWKPLGKYPEFDVHGLCGYYGTTDNSVIDIINRFGWVPAGLRNMNRYDRVTLHTYYDTAFTAMWLDSDDLMLKAHELPEIPVMVQITDGSNLFDKPEEQRQPLLYTLIKSGLWDKQSMAMSAIMSAVFQMGVTPTIKHRQGASGKTLEESIDFSQTPAVIELEQGEDVDPMLNKGIIDPSVMEALHLAETKGEESAVYKQAFGAQVAGSQPYSSLALLSQAGRLPLIGSQTRGAWGISRTVALALTMLKDSKNSYNKNGIKLSLASIPENIQVETKLDVKLPQDKLQMANIAQLLYTNKMASLEWIQENILQITDTEAMRDQIWTEEAETQMLALTIQQIMQSEQPPAPGTEQVPTDAPPMETPVMPEQQPRMTSQPMMVPGQAEGIQGGLPAAQGGMIPGAGRAVAPPEGAING